MNSDLDLKLQQLPDSPGVYIMKSGGEIIYVGKAISLKNRVRQYFQSSRGHGPKVQAMVEKIDDFDIILCDGELEALILECNLIKRHKPWYNILLKDDKQYPYIRIDLRQKYPRVELVRQMGKDGAKYYGPYQGATVVRDVLEVLRNVFPLRTCTKELEKKLPQGRPCIQHEMGNCLAPCTGEVGPAEYKEVIAQVLSFLGGRHEDILKSLREDMLEASKQLKFERAGVLRDRIAAIEGILQRQKAVSTGGEDQDVLAAASDGVDAVVCALFIRGGKLIGSDTFVLERAGDEAENGGEWLSMFLLQYYGGASFIPREILLHSAADDAEIIAELLTREKGTKVTVAVPQRAHKRQLVDMAHKNAVDAAAKRAADFATKRARTLGACEQLRDALGMPRTPRRIECYDISNTQGALSIGSMVVFRDGKSSPKDYRQFRIRSVEQPNDFASMAEVISRRFTHAMKEAEELRGQGADPSEGKFSDLPDAVLIDGGPEQLRFALDAARETGISPMPFFFSLAKRFEEVYLPGSREPVLLDSHSDALHLLQRLRDEAHRFGITQHRKLRGKQSIKSRLEEVPGIGPARRRALLNHFRTLDAVKRAEVEDLAAVPGMTVPSAQALYDALRG